MPSPNHHPRDEVWNNGYTQLMEKTGTPEKPSLIVLHSEDWKDGPQDAVGLAEAMQNDGKSYHFLVDQDGKTVVNAVPTSEASRSVMDPGNNMSININMAGTWSDGWSRDDWLARDSQLRTTAELAVREAIANGIPPVVVEEGSGTSGIVSHSWVANHVPVNYAGGWTDAERHHDVGANTSAFPWDRFSEYVRQAAAARGYTQ